MVAKFPGKMILPITATNSSNIGYFPLNVTSPVMLAVSGTEYTSECLRRGEPTLCKALSFSLMSFLPVKVFNSGLILLEKLENARNLSLSD